MRKKQKQKQTNEELEKAYNSSGRIPLLMVSCWFVALIACFVLGIEDERITGGIGMGVVTVAFIIGVAMWKIKPGALYFYFFSIFGCALVLGAAANWFPNNVQTGRLVLGSIVWLIVLVWWYGVRSAWLSRKGKKICLACDVDNKLTEPSPWLEVPYTGPCYICVGKGEFPTDSAHFEAAQLLDKYRQDHDTTQNEYDTMATSLKELREQAKQGPVGIGEDLYRQTMELIKQYEDQTALRRQQLDFLEEGMRKLHRMLYNSFLAENMLAKQKALVDLREDNTTDLGTIMARKEQLQTHYEVLDRINALSIEIDMHQTTSIAKDLRREIQEMQREL